MMYMAGILDNSLYCIADPKKSSLTIHYKTFDESFMKWLVYYFGGSYEDASTQRVITFQWRLCGSRIQLLIYKAHQYQHIKKRHSILALKYIATFVGIGHKLTSDVILRRQAINDELHTLNALKIRKPVLTTSPVKQDVSFMDLPLDNEPSFFDMFNPEQDLNTDEVSLLEKLFLESKR